MLGLRRTRFGTEKEDGSEKIPSSTALKSRREQAQIRKNIQPLTNNGVDFRIS